MSFQFSISFLVFDFVLQECKKEFIMVEMCSSCVVVPCHAQSRGEGICMVVYIGGMLTVLRYTTEMIHLVVGSSMYL